MEKLALMEKLHSLGLKEKLQKLGLKEKWQKLALKEKWNSFMNVSFAKTAAVLGAAGIITFVGAAVGFGISDKKNITVDTDLSVKPRVSIFESRRYAAGNLSSQSAFDAYKPETVFEATEAKGKTAGELEAEKLNVKRSLLQETAVGKPGAPENAETPNVAEHTQLRDVDKPQAVYHGVITYTQEEFDMMCCVVMHEVGYCSEQMKLAISNVIINRVKSPKFPNNIKEVLHQRNQFTAINNYYNRIYEPDADTVACVSRALNGEGAYLVNGGDSYYAVDLITPDKAQWFETHLTYCTTLENARFFQV